MTEFAINQCLECGKPLVGRRDKKFCDTECRAAHHNKNKSMAELDIQHTQSAIRHNRKILRTLCPHGKATVRREVMDQMGFRFDLFTGIFKTTIGNYYMLVDFGYSPIVENGVQKALIIQRQAYMDRQPFDPWMK